jgi:hypothetical protein
LEENGGIILGAAERKTEWGDFFKKMGSEPHFLFAYSVLKMHKCTVAGGVGRGERRRLRPGMKPKRALDWIDKQKGKEGPQSIPNPR